MTSNPHKHEEEDERPLKMMLPQSAVISSTLTTRIIRESNKVRTKGEAKHHLRQRTLYKWLFPL